MPDYTVEVTYKVRHLLEVGTDGPDTAESIAEELVLANTNWGDMKHSTLLSEYTSVVKEKSNA